MSNTLFAAQSVHPGSPDRKRSRAFAESLWPPLIYAEPETIAVLREVWRARTEGLGVWFTMDAGPNVKLLFDAADEGVVRERFAGVRVIEPFGA